MPTALVGLGSNLGDRRQLLDRAVQLLAATGGVRSVRSSSWRATHPVGGPSNQPEFLNGAVLVETSLSPEALLARLQEIEASLGRVRKQRWEPRTVDLDLLLYDDLVRHWPPLDLPHPRMALRRFVLEGAAEVAAALRHPTIGWTMAELLNHLRTATPYVAVSGSLFRATWQLAFAAAAKTGWRMLEFPGAGEKAPPAGSPSLTVSRTIEFLHEQAELLAHDRWPPDPGGVISPFWIEDLLAIGDVLWPGALDETWQGLRATIVAPKLLVVYEPTEHFAQGGEPEGQRLSEPAVGVWKRFHEVRQNRAGRRGIGPVLWLEDCDPTAAETELVAAIEAMR